MKIAFGVLCLVSAASAMAYPYAFAYPYPVGFGHHGFGVGVEKHVGISHVGIKPWLKLGVGYGMLKPALIGYGLGVATGVGGGVAAGVGITKGLALLKGIKLLGMYPGGFGVGYGYKFIKG